MVERVKTKQKKIGNYFAAPKEEHNFIRSGSKRLDLALGGGWALGPMANIVGDKSTGKTLLAIEAMNSFAGKFKDGRICYRETEAAFSQQYAAALGLPIKRVDFGKDQLETVEHMYEDLNGVVRKAKEPTIYVVDSLDALSDQAEMERAFDKGSYGAAKAKGLSKMFRQLVRPLSDRDCFLLIVSQIRDRIGITFGPTKSRSGGHALDFYASHALWLAQVKPIDKRISGIKQTVGVEIRANIKKNKISVPFKECQLKILFGYGLDDVEFCIEYLQQAGVDIPTEFTWKVMKKLQNRDEDEYWNRVNRIYKLLEKTWYEVEEKFLPKIRKRAYA